MMVEIDATPVERENSAQALKNLVTRSDAAGLTQLARHAVVLVVTATLIMAARHSLWLWPAMFVHGVALVFLFAPLHETIHRTAFATRWLNDAVAFVIGVLLVLPREYFRAFHFAHHRHTQDPARDPELSTPRPATRRQWLLYVSGLPYWYWQLRGLVTRALGQVPEDFYGNDTQRQKVIAESRLIIGIYGAILTLSLAAGSDIALRYWLLPVLLGQPMLRLYLLAEHWGCPLAPAPMLQRSRTTYTHPIVRFLAWNMPYHAEHHANPAVPFHALPQANALLAGEIGTTSPGYVAASCWIYERLS
ncbi:fatty acid desaturase [Dongia rigui]|uniref:Fatty acid desaturase n=1 Tax=Dongia rigui TaxID=940149 RepID=A0ABU5DX16_9PROT|nr:fatty acid desaturase [Dongia rigui]MDY0871853.1 fatty acid desaturase [Dongia rigui]